MESIKEARVIYAHAIQDAEALCSATVKEAKATCICTIWEAKALCSMAIRDAEIWGASQADSLQWRHAKTIQHLEEQVIQGEGKSQIDFLSTCQATIQASPVELQGTRVASYHILMGQAPMSHPFTLSQGASPTEPVSAPAGSFTLPVLEHSPQTKIVHHPSSDPVDVTPPGRTMHPRQTQKGPPVKNGKRYYLYTRC